MVGRKSGLIVLVENRRYFLLAREIATLSSREAFFHSRYPLFLPSQRAAMRKRILDNPPPRQGRPLSEPVDSAIKILGNIVVVAH